MPALAIGTGVRLGRFEILSQAGVGGMGDVYRALDTRLDRIVALKMLNPDPASGPIGQARFEREARAISNLAHPNICTLYDLCEVDNHYFLVMEYLTGETLADRLREGPLPLRQVLRSGVELASALAHVHRLGFIHRDVKPANVMLAETGVKLFDFGISKNLLESVTGSGTRPPSSTLTLDGALIGTVEYMAPEQLEGFEADSRSDIFSLGLVLFEMFAGVKPFEGRSPASVIAAILTAEPRTVTWPAGPGSQLEHVIKKCLAKNPQDRWQSADDLKSDLEWLQHTLLQPPEKEAARTRSRSVPIGAMVVASVAALAFVAFLATNRTRAPRAVGDSAALIQALAPVNPGNSELLYALHAAISPNGRYLVRTATTPGRSRGLFLRDLSSGTERELPGTQGGGGPFWSPDSTSLAFFADGHVKVTTIDGDAPRIVGTPPTGPVTAGTWNRDGVILTGNYDTGLSRISASGGGTTTLTTLDAAAGELGHNFPQFLPDGRHFLYHVRSRHPEHTGVYVASLDATEKGRLLLRVRSKAEYAAPGYLIYQRDRTLLAHPFDAATQTATGSPVAIAHSTAFAEGEARTAFSVSQSGVIAYQQLEKTELVWRDRSGRRVGTAGPSDFDEDPVLSPDGRRLAVSRRDAQSGRRRIWIVSLDTMTRVFRRLTDRADHDEISPVWAPDGAEVAYSVAVAGRFEIHATRLESGDTRMLWQPESDAWALDWSKDGRFLIAAGGSEPSDLWVVPMSGAGEPKRLARTPPLKPAAQISPDGARIAYVSLIDNTFEVSVSRFPAGDQIVRISNGGGTEPHWSATGRELFYLTPAGALTTVSIPDGQEPVVASQSRLFNIERIGIELITSLARRQYGFDAGSNRFLVNEPQVSSASAPITLLVNWTHALE